MKKFAILLISLLLLSCSKETDNKYCWECQQKSENGRINRTITLCDETEVEILDYEREQDAAAIEGYREGLLSQPATMHCSKK